ncbi:hypothetical protein UAY_01007 [Enterococcus moraviensis ATCC BAA-383]|uniref:Lipoprotein n=1 Tax=Enterococcus moraviensis ATCC BAA-383 TaxID=1158609 RepID=R2R1Y0_9ENTE|nr:DUF1307 domain-containing protein [Enterococcus moraviensis]EOI01601.1 hypothetical protein UAY_01007 [Enterococcus moraviensis ATCC BAA-383]EOT73864.1 hypothetical protein I586_00860 [Enterococcus moraviensis ATCC BAA-383]OJG64743.1 hypothetical protein RV09_GL001405 [Enterococcus moraviensis]
MKKNVFCIMGMFVLFSLSACTEQEQTTTFVLKQDDENVKVQNIHKKDELSKQKITTTIQYKTMGITTKTKAEKLLEPSKKLYSDKKGIHYTIDFTEKAAVETIEVDLKKVSTKDAKEISLISLPNESFATASEEANEAQLIKLGFKKEK